MRPLAENQPIPVASLTALYSASCVADASESPHQAVYTPRPLNAIDNGASAPEARAISTCLALRRSHLFQSHRWHAEDVARCPHAMKSLSETESLRNASTARRRLGAPAARPSVTITARPSRNRSHAEAPGEAG